MCKINSQWEADHEGVVSEWKILYVKFYDLYVWLFLSSILHDHLCIYSEGPMCPYEWHNSYSQIAFAL